MNQISLMFDKAISHIDNFRFNLATLMLDTIVDEYLNDTSELDKWVGRQVSDTLDKIRGLMMINKNLRYQIYSIAEKDISYYQKIFSFVKVWGDKYKSVEMKKFFIVTSIDEASQSTNNILHHLQINIKTFPEINRITGKDLLGNSRYYNEFLASPQQRIYIKPYENAASLISAYQNSRAIDLIIFSLLDFLRTKCYDDFIIVAFDFLSEVPLTAKTKLIRKIIKSIFEAKLEGFVPEDQSIIYFYFNSHSDRILFEEQYNELIVLLEYEKTNVELTSFTYSHPLVNRIYGHPQESIKNLIDRTSQFPFFMLQENKFIEHFPTFSDILLDQLRSLSVVVNLKNTILLLGESGVGKTRLAESVHKLSKFKSEKFIPINCSNYPEGMIDGELFGYEKGSFTGAVRRHIGKIELSDHGTIFIDEIDKAPLNVQAKLIKVVEEKKFFRLGGNEEIKIDARFIFATNRPVDELLNSGKLLEDFYFRISQFVLTIPPLRERNVDTITAAGIIKNELELEVGHHAEFSLDCNNVLGSYEWPGNYRQLETAIFNCLIECKVNGSGVISGELLKRKAEEKSLPDYRERIIRNFNEAIGSSFIIWKNKREEIKELLNSAAYEGKQIGKKINQYSYLKSFIEPGIANYFEKYFENNTVVKREVSELLGISWAQGQDSTLAVKSKLFLDIKKILLSKNEGRKD